MSYTRSYFPGMGEAVANRTVNRKIFTEDQRLALPKVLKLNPNDPLYIAWKNAADLSEYPTEISDKAKFMPAAPELRTEEWKDVAKRVAAGNASLAGDSESEEAKMYHHLAQASLLMSGRHLQHGDINQAQRPMEVFTNCLEKSTRILTMEYGPIEIGKIAGQTVTVIAGDGVPRPAKINEHGEQDLFKITFRGMNGGNYRKTVVATANHRWFLRDGVTDALKVGDVLRSIKPLHQTGFERDPEAVIHGLIFGDGSAHKRRHDHERATISAGRTYASIRVCKQDAVRDEIHDLLDVAGYRYSTPAHAEGDRVYYLGKGDHLKALPICNDPEYVAGFIYGWWLADGSKTPADGILEISTSDTEAADWLEEHAGYAGLNATMRRVMERSENDGSFVNGKPLNVLRVRQSVEWKVESIEPAGRDVVYCPEEPVTSSFVLANGLLTGNCSTAAATFLLFYLLLNGSGVGRAYDDDMMKVDWANMPDVHIVIDGDYADRKKFTTEWNGVEMAQVPMIGDEFKTPEYMKAVLANSDFPVTWFAVPDSRGGWAKAIELMERMAFEGRKDEVLVLDFSGVRPNGSPIKGMQNRPASGPGPLMKAIAKIAEVKHLPLARWEATMRIDHYAAECVLVGGARRAARMATKRWDDITIFDFIAFKRKGEWWSSNNSVTIDDEFRERCIKVSKQYASFGHDITNVDFAQKLYHAGAIDFMDCHAWQVLFALADAAYHDGTGEPGLINQDKLHSNNIGIDAYLDGLFANSKDFQVDPETLPLMQSLATAVFNANYTMITNPCGEITLLMLGGYCVIADVVPFHAANDDDAEDAFRTAVRALIRTNLMDSLYNREVKRTNRIGVGITGFHEWAFDRFSFSWRDIVNEQKSLPMWQMLSRFKRAIVDEAKRYSEKLGVTVPHTDTTFKPAGTTSKLFGLSEGAHLPSMRWFMRWVQFRNDDPLILEYEAKGYPVRRDLKSYSGTTIVGFPTAPAICQLGDGEWVVTAAEATPEEQYRFIALIEKYWIVGVEEDGITPLVDSGNQVSYTLKYRPDLVSFAEFLKTLIDGQFSIRCCSVMPQGDLTVYEYQPEEPLTRESYLAAAGKIKSGSDLKEEIGFEHVDCGSGSCPIDFEERKV